jgi:flavin-dependent dehydrogenase
MLAASTHTRLRLPGTHARTPLQVFAAGSQLLTPCVGNGWIATGEAAAAVDPLSSLGVGHALLSGIEAARSAAACLAGDSRLMQLYSESVARNFYESWNLRSGYYSIERRWSKRRFWFRRRNPQMTMNSSYK